jgi:chromosome partitioning protein
MPQTMRVLVFASQKGGSGKTTMAGHIGVMAELAGAGPVALIDTDPQGSLAKWWNCREAPQPAFIHSTFNNLVHDLDQARDQGFKLVVIDTPPAVTKAISEVVAFADLVVLPTRPSPHDLRAVGPTIDIVEARKKQMVFALNCAAARAKITSEAAVALSQHGTVAPAIVHNRTDFAASMIDGRTVMEADPDGKSAEEIRALWTYLAGRLAKLDAYDERDPALSHLIHHAPKNMNGLGREAPLFGRRAATS